MTSNTNLPYQVTTGMLETPQELKDIAAIGAYLSNVRFEYSIVSGFPASYAKQNQHRIKQNLLQVTEQLQSLAAQFAEDNTHNPDTK